MPSASREDEAALVRDCIAGDDLAWERLLREYTGCALAAIKTALRQHGRRSDRALEDEIVANTFEVLAQDDGSVLRSFRGESGLGTFISVVAARGVHRFFRSQSRFGRAVEKRAEADRRSGHGGEEDPAERADAQERANLLIAAIAELAPTDKLLLTLYYLDGRTYREIALATGRAATGIGTLIGRARARLRESISKRGINLDDHESPEPPKEGDDE